MPDKYADNSWCGQRNWWNNLKRAFLKKNIKRADIHAELREDEGYDSTFNYGEWVNIIDRIFWLESHWKQDFRKVRPTKLLHMQWDIFIHVYSEKAAKKVFFFFWRKMSDSLIKTGWCLGIAKKIRSVYGSDLEISNNINQIHWNYIHMPFPFNLMKMSTR